MCSNYFGKHSSAVTSIIIPVSYNNLVLSFHYKDFVDEISLRSQKQKRTRYPRSHFCSPPKATLSSLPFPVPRARATSELSPQQPTGDNERLRRY